MEAGRKRIAVLTTDGVEESEIRQPIEALREAGMIADVVAPGSSEVQAMRHDERSSRMPVDRRLSDVNPDDYDAVVLPGGALNADKLRMEPMARDFVRTLDEEGKVIAAICHAPWLLVSSGLVRGRKLTSYYTLQDDIRNAGGDWEDREVVVDGNLVTSRGPNDLPAFDRELVNRVTQSGATPASRSRIAT